MIRAKAPRKAGWWIASGVAYFSAVVAVVLLTLAALAIPFANEGLSVVKQHFGEPASVFPAQDVATFFLMAAFMAALISAYCWVLARAVAPLKGPPYGRSLKVLAWLMLAMHIAVFPLGDAALVVETAFKGPTSEVVLAYEVIAFLALLTLFAFAQVRVSHEHGGESGGRRGGRSSERQGIQT